jgi:16S rRNA G966 N2-methylase RsmD
MNATNYLFIKKTLSELKATEINAIKGDTFKYIERCGSKFDVIFADPPYDHPRLQEIPDLVFQNDALHGEGLLILEHPKEFSFEDHPNFLEHRKYGHVNFTFFQKTTE